MATLCAIRMLLTHKCPLGPFRRVNGDRVIEASDADRNRPRKSANRGFAVPTVGAGEFLGALVRVHAASGEPVTVRGGFERLPMEAVIQQSAHTRTDERLQSAACASILEHQLVSDVDVEPLQEIASGSFGVV